MKRKGNTSRTRIKRNKSRAGKYYNETRKRDRLMCSTCKLYLHYCTCDKEVK